MVAVAGKPFLEWLILQSKANGVRRLVLCTGYLADAIESYFGDGAKWEVDLVYSRETVMMGTGGALRLAVGMTESKSILVLNGDSYCCYDLPILMEKLQQEQARAVLWLVHADDSSRFGSVQIDSEGSILSFDEKSPGGPSGLINAGVYLVRKEFIESIPNGMPISLEREVLPGRIGKGVYGVADNGPFIDIGTPESYARAEDFMRNVMTR
jgi:NDP-sugar pyrophosphorylase family protein